MTARWLLSGDEGGAVVHPLPYPLGAVKSRLLSDGNGRSKSHSYIRGEKLTRAGLLPVRKLSAVSE
jgi:hypothetical protein